MPDTTTAPAPDLTPTERAIDTMRGRRDAAPYPLTGDEWLLLAEVERLQDVIAKLRNAQDLAAQLTERLAALQDGNEGAYRELYDAMNGPHFCPDRPFGQTAAAEQVAS